MDLLYRFNFGQHHRLEPSIAYFNEDLDGDAMCKWGVDFQLTYFYFNAPITLVANGLIGMADYDKRNPIYGKTRDDDRYGAGLQFYYADPFGWKPFGENSFNIYVAGSYFYENADIDFYDTEVVSGSAGVLLRF